MIRDTSAGWVPSVPSLLNEWSTLSVQLPSPFGVSAKTEPYPCAPPHPVVPERFPAESKMRLAWGPAPSAPPVNLYSVLYLLAAAALGTHSRVTMKTVTTIKAVPRVRENFLSGITLPPIRSFVNEDQV